MIPFPACLAGKDTRHRRIPSKIDVLLGIFVSNDDDDGGDDVDDEDEDDDNGDDNDDWYFGLKGRRSRSPGQRPGYWWTTVIFALKGQKLLQGVLATHRIYLGRGPGLGALWPVRPFFCGTCEA